MASIIAAPPMGLAEGMQRVVANEMRSILAREAGYLRRASKVPLEEEQAVVLDLLETAGGDGLLPLELLLEISAANAAKEKLTEVMWCRQLLERHGGRIESLRLIWRALIEVRREPWFPWAAAH